MPAHVCSDVRDTIIPKVSHFRQGVDPGRVLHDQRNRQRVLAFRRAVIGRLETGELNSL